MAEQENTGDGSQASLFKAAQYVRMSTEHQQYSTENQGDKIKEYAAHRGIEIIKTYTDAGKSGLRIDGRQALQQLIKDVETGAADFQIILVYDVSRWPSSYLRRSPRLTGSRSGVNWAFMDQSFPVSFLTAFMSTFCSGETAVVAASGWIIEVISGLSAREASKTLRT